MPTYSVNEAIESLEWLVGKDITVRGLLSFQFENIERLHGKVVVVEGTLQGPAPNFGGCGHVSLWPAEMVARTLERAPTAR